MILTALKGEIMYDQQLGQFISRDPLPEHAKNIVDMSPWAQQWERNVAKWGWGYHNGAVVEAYTKPYTYVRNNPVNDVDPSGLQPEFMVGLLEQLTRQQSPLVPPDLQRLLDQIEKADEEMQRKAEIDNALKSPIQSCISRVPQQPSYASKKKKQKFRCTTKPRGNCPPQCQERFIGYGETYEIAKDAAEAACQAQGCHTPGGTPFGCDCGHSVCNERPN